MSGGPTLLVVSSGSMDASVRARNALGRLTAIRAAGLFDRVEYVFFRTESAGTWEVADGFRVHDVSGREPGGLAGSLRWTRALGLLRSGYREIRELAERVRPDVVHAQDPFLMGAMARRLARGLGRPFSVMVYSNFLLSYRVSGVKPLPLLPARVSFALERRVYGAADLVFTDCAHYEAYAVGRGAPRDRVCTVPRYADPLFYEADPDPEIFRSLGVDDPAPMVYVGRLSPEKYALDLIEAFAGVRDAHPRRRLLVVGGEGSERKAALERAEALGVRDGIHLLEGLSRHEIFSVLAGAGAVLATHAGYALLEAALAGAPIVAYDYEWHPELIDDGETGLLVPYRDPAAMADAAARLLDDPDLAGRLGRNARARARESYTPDAHEKGLRAGFERLLGQDPGS